jgi:hypothetical protein
MEREILGAVESGSGSDWTSAVRESASTRGGEAAGKKGSCGPATHTFGSSGGTGSWSLGSAPDFSVATTAAPSKAVAKPRCG